MILVYGATGTTGSLITEELVRRGLPVAIAGRDRRRLDELGARLGVADVRPARVHEPGELADAIRGARVVIACAGPFLLVGEPVLRAALDAGAHYLDTTGEQAFMRTSYERYDSRARRAGLAAVPGFAFEVALGDWAASRAATLVRAEDDADEDAGVDEIAIGYAMRGFRASAGTMESAIATLAQPACVWQEDRWERAAPGSRKRRFRFPEPFGEQSGLLFPSGEVITVPRHVQSRRVETYLAWGEETQWTRAVSRVAGLVGPFLPALAASPLGALARSYAGAARGPTAEARRSALFALVAEATLRFRHARVSLSGVDPYGVTARIVGGAAQALLHGAPREVGVLAPSQLVDPAEGLAELVGEGMIAVEEE